MKRRESDLIENVAIVFCRRGWGKVSLQRSIDTTVHLGRTTVLLPALNFHCHPVESRNRFLSASKKAVIIIKKKSARPYEVREEPPIGRSGAGWRLVAAFLLLLSKILPSKQQIRFLILCHRTPTTNPHVYRGLWRSTWYVYVYIYLYFATIEDVELSLFFCILVRAAFFFWFIGMSLREVSISIQCVWQHPAADFDNIDLPLRSTSIYSLAACIE